MKQMSWYNNTYAWSKAQYTEATPPKNQEAEKKATSWGFLSFFFFLSQLSEHNAGKNETP